jgi:hypothetical protein
MHGRGRASRVATPAAATIELDRGPHAPRHRLFDSDAPGPGDEAAFFDSLPDDVPMTLAGYHC